MENLLTYIIQVNLLLALIFLGYYFLLKGMTFYILNRVYFIIASIYAFVYPFVDVKSWFIDNEVMSVEYLPELWAQLLAMQNQNTTVEVVTLTDILIGVVGIVGVAFIFKLLIQLLSLFRIHLHSKTSNWQSYIFRNVLFPVVPFSFFNKIYVHKEQHQEKELQDIFAHESIHVSGHHTLDILLFEIILVVCWYNPFVWLMRKAVRQNLEFLTDQQVLNKGVDKQTYQYSLLHVTKQGAAVGISNQFNFKTLKKRIIMMNKKRSSKLELSKYAFLLPVFLIAGMSFTVSKAEKNIEKIVEITNETPLDVSILNSLPPVKDKALGVDSFMDSKIADEIFTDSVGYVLDDQLVSIDDLKKVKADDIEIIMLNDNNEITKKYLKKSILSINTKRYSGTFGTPSLYKGFSIDTKNNISIKGGYIKAITGNNVSRPINEVPGVSFVADTTRYNKDRIILRGVESLGFNNATPLIILEGREIDPEQFKLISSNDIESINVLKDKRATAIYGDKGKAGVMVINTKKSPSASINSTTFKQTKDSDTSKVIKIVGLNVDPSKKPLYKIDDKEIEDLDLESLNPNDIESISVFKVDNEVYKYGAKAKNGVIRITTKKNTPKAVTIRGYKKDTLNNSPIYADRSKGFSVAVEAGNAANSNVPNEVTVTGYKKDKSNTDSSKTVSNEEVKEIEVTGHKKK